MEVDREGVEKEAARLFSQGQKPGRTDGEQQQQELRHRAVGLLLL